MDRSWIKTRLFSKSHLDGVSEFMNFISERFDDDAEILCPCRRCLNRIHGHKGQVEDHLYIYGMASTYSRWIYHGEPYLNAENNENTNNLDEHTILNEEIGMNENEEDDLDRIPDMVRELFVAEDESRAKKSMFAILLDEMKQELYPGSTYTGFSFVVKLLHIKSLHRVSNVAFNALLKLLSLAFPNCSIPASYYEAKKLLRALGLGYESIHVCPNNCILFRKNFEKHDKCPVCGASRWKDTNGEKQVPHKKRHSQSMKKKRAHEMMRINQRLQSLGITALVSMMNNKTQKSKATAPKDPDPLYNPVEDDNTEDMPDTESDNTTTKTTGAATRLTKRVVAPQEQDQIARVTRKRTRELSAQELSAPNEEGGSGTTTNEQECFMGAALVSANCPTQLEDQIQMSNEDEPIDRRRMGKGLDRMNRGLITSLPVHIAEGKKRPEAAIQAAKLATEGGIILRQHIPILSHWKEYKKDDSLISNYMNKVCGQFTIDKDSLAVKEACVDMMRSGQRQWRHKLKKKYFDDIPANQVRTTSPIKTITDEQWRELVEMWSTPRHKERCLKSKRNREKVVFQQKTGSRCYIAHAHLAKQEKYKDAPPTAIDLFKECHYSKKSGFTEPVKKAIADMEAIVAQAVEDGQPPKTPTEAVSVVLPNTKFLTNIGFQSAAPKRCA